MGTASRPLSLTNGFVQPAISSPAASESLPADLHSHRWGFLPGASASRSRGSPAARTARVYSALAFHARPARCSTSRLQPPPPYSALPASARSSGWIERKQEIGRAHV